jgi:uncharacterized protein
MNDALLWTALLMGLTGGPHCAAMCGAACTGIGRSTRGLLQFQCGRVAGYAALGAVAAVSFQSIGWLANATSGARTLWTLFHLAALLLGLSLLVQGRQPVWLNAFGTRMWARVRPQSALRGARAPAPWVAGMLWAFMPCGLLYSALLLAVLTGSALQGAAAMGLFAAGSAVSLAVGPWLWRRYRQRLPTALATRLAGAALAALCIWALWMGAMGQPIPWCATA